VPFVLHGGAHMIQVRKWRLGVVRLITLFACLVVKAQELKILIQVPVQESVRSGLLFSVKFSLTLIIFAHLRATEIRVQTREIVSDVETEPFCSNSTRAVLSRSALLLNASCGATAARALPG